RPEPEDRLVLGPFAVAVVLAVAGDLGDAPAVDDAAVAAAVAGHEVFLHADAVHARRALVGAELEVVDRQHADHVHVVDGAGGPEHGEAARDRRPTDRLHRGPRRGDEPGGVRDPHAAGAPAGDRLQVLRAHDAADAGPARRPSAVVHHARRARAMLAGRTDR